MVNISLIYNIFDLTYGGTVEVNPQVLPNGGVSKLCQVLTLEDLSEFIHER